MRKPTSIVSKSLIISLALIASGVASLVDLGQAYAGSMTETIVRLDRLSYSTAVGGRVCAKASSTATEAKVAVTFPTAAATDYVLSATLSAWSATGVADAALSASAWPGLSATSATTVSGHTVTWASGDLTAGTLYCFQFAGGLTTANNNTESSPGNVQTQDAGSAAIDTGNYSIGLGSGGSDQVALTGATVPPTFTFALSGTTDSFPSNLKLNQWTATSGRNITITTNAANGYIVWAKDAQNNGNIGSLKSATANSYITTASAVGSAAHTYSVGAADYGLAAQVTTNGSGTAAPTSAYNYNAGTTIGVLDPVNFQRVATATTPTASDVINVVEKASAATTTKAANDYADTITFVGAGYF